MQRRRSTWWGKKYTIRLLRRSSSTTKWRDRLGSRLLISSRTWPMPSSRDFTLLSTSLNKLRSFSSLNTLQMIFFSKDLKRLIGGTSWVPSETRDNAGLATHLQLYQLLRVIIILNMAASLNYPSSKSLIAQRHALAVTVAGFQTLLNT